MEKMEIKPGILVLIKENQKYGKIKRIIKTTVSGHELKEEEYCYEIKYVEIDGLLDFQQTFSTTICERNEFLLLNEIPKK